MQIYLHGMRELSTANVYITFDACVRVLAIFLKTLIASTY